MMSIRIVIFVGLELAVMLIEHSLNIKGIALAAFIPFITMICGMLYCIPPKKMLVKNCGEMPLTLLPLFC